MACRSGRRGAVGLKGRGACSLMHGGGSACARRPPSIGIRNADFALDGTPLPDIDVLGTTDRQPDFAGPALRLRAPRWRTSPASTSTSTALGGPADAPVLDALIQEVTPEGRCRGRGAETIPHRAGRRRSARRSQAARRRPLRPRPRAPQLAAPGGDIAIISARHLNAVYRIRRATARSTGSSAALRVGEPRICRRPFRWASRHTARRVARRDADRPRQRLTSRGLPPLVLRLRARPGGRGPLRCVEQGCSTPRAGEPRSAAAARRGLAWAVSG